MAQRSAEDVAKFLGVAPDNPMVLEHLQAAGQIDDAAARTARRLGDSGAPGTDSWTRVLSRRARRACATRASAPVPATPAAPKRRGDVAGNPSSAKQDPDRPSAAEDRKASRREVDRSARRSQGGEWSDDDGDDDMPPPPPPRPQAPPAPPQQPPARQPSSPPRAMDEEGNDSTEYSWDSDRDSDPGSKEPLHPHQRYAQLVSMKSLTNMATADLLRVLDEFKRLTHAVKPGAYEKTCASLELSEPVPVLAATVVERLVGFLGINDALLVFDAKEKDVAVRESSRAATLRADVTRWKEAKGRAAQAALQAERASAPKSVEDSVKALKHSFELREKCSVACLNAVRWSTSAGCTCDASNSWSSRGILVDITGKSKPRLHFSDGTSFEVYSLSALKTRLRPAGGGSGEEAVALLQEAARAARDKPGWKADVILAWE